MAIPELGYFPPPPSRPPPPLSVCLIMNLQPFFNNVARVVKEWLFLCVFSCCFTEMLPWHNLVEWNMNWKLPPFRTVTVIRSRNVKSGLHVRAFTPAWHQYRLFPTHCAYMAKKEEKKRKEKKKKKVTGYILMLAGVKKRSPITSNCKRFESLPAKSVIGFYVFDYSRFYERP